MSNLETIQVSTLIDSIDEVYEKIHNINAKEMLREILSELLDCDINAATLLQAMYDETTLISARQSDGILAELARSLPGYIKDKSKINELFRTAISNPPKKEKKQKQKKEIVLPSNEDNALEKLIDSKQLILNTEDYSTERHRTYQRHGGTIMPIAAWVGKKILEIYLPPSVQDYQKFELIHFPKGTNKADLLQLFFDKKGEWVSVEEIMKVLKISRQQAINVVSNLSFEIDNQSKRTRPIEIKPHAVGRKIQGYRLQPTQILLNKL